ncbi:CoA:oxalate CoA-transferase [Chelatococcus caeni]|uniref:CoA:oxalate CoA-transferase n=2 Tax=Chelatococcus TaxID=28209 RepID=A0A840BZB0_9HYPH|nr:CoA transferase [Chelatococcus caeni]MBB4016619.1 CoA:oxalate CoA-transferase [Chelatococcus caeni]
MSGGAAMKPLADLRVLDFSRVLAGPYCTALLADLGAQVIKVEPPGGDDYRHIGPFVEGESMLFATVNRGKRSIVLDLAKAEDLAVAHALAARADVVVENFRPGVADKLGIGWAQLSALNPRLVYASISGFGQEGELAKRPAYDVILQAMSGIMAVTGEPDGPPTLVGESIADVAAGLFASWAVLAALHERHGTGRGRHIDLAMFDAMVALQPLVVARYLATGDAPRRVGNRHPLSAPFGAFAARDGSFVLAVLNDKLFQRLATCIGAPEIAADPRFATDSDRLANEGALRALIEAWSRQRRAREAVEALVAHGVPAAEINDMAEALASPHAEARGLLQEVSDARAGMRQVPEQPARFAGAPRGGLAAAPRLDGDRAAILADLEDRT